LRRQFDLYTGYTPAQKGAAHWGTDGLDVLVDGLLQVEACPTATEAPGPDMIHYQPTPARVVLDLVDHAGLQPSDVVYDLGSGLGQVVILVNLLSGVRAKGVEIDPGLCHCAQECARQLGRLNVDFVNADARDADYSDGTVFYMFRPFKGAVLQAVLEKLRHEAQKRRLRLCTYGACTPDVAKLAWVESLDDNTGHEFKLALFQTI
jgi:SAM-dependent methyltransferase